MTFNIFSMLSITKLVPFKALDAWKMHSKLHCKIKLVSYLYNLKHMKTTYRWYMNPIDQILTALGIVSWEIQIGQLATVFQGLGSMASIIPIPCKIPSTHCYIWPLRAIVLYSRISWYKDQNPCQQVKHFGLLLRFVQSPVIHIYNSNRMLQWLSVRPIYLTNYTNSMFILSFITA